MGNLVALKSMLSYFWDLLRKARLTLLPSDIKHCNSQRYLVPEGQAMSIKYCLKVFQIMTLGKKWQTEDSSAKSGADDHGRIKYQKVDWLFLIPLQTRRVSETAHNCSSELFLMRRPQARGL